MKTRKKGKVISTKGRRSSILGVKSPVRKNVRRNPPRNNKNNLRNTSVESYESPLMSLKFNNLKNASTSNKSENEAMKTEEVDLTELSITELPSTPKKSVSPVKTIKKEATASRSPRNLVFSHIKTEKVVPTGSKSQGNSVCSHLKNEKIETTEPTSQVIDKEPHIDVIDNKSQPSKTFNRKKRKIEAYINSGGRTNRKLRKSILSRFNDDSQPLKKVKIDNTIVLDDDSESDGESCPSQFIKPSVDDNVLTEKILNSCADQLDDSHVVESKPSTSVQCEASKTSNDIVVLDSDLNDSSLMEMEAYHDAFNQSSENVKSQFLESVIELDPDDETQEEETQKSLPRTSEDCFVVWSSLPQPCTSKERSESLLRPFSEIDSDLLKQDKILIDTKPMLTNITRMNNENNKPLQKFRKTLKVNTKGMKKTPPKSYLDKIKMMKANSLIKPIPSFTKQVTKVTKAKSNQQLIFLSESLTEEAKTRKDSRKGKLREIIIDGNNVGMAYTNNRQFSEKGIKMLIDYFTKRGHTVKVFIPQYRRGRNYPLLEEWYSKGIVVFTPSRKLGNKSYTPYDDRYILEYATTCDGIVVSQDQFRDLYAEKIQYRNTIERRLLVPTFVGDYVMFPEDPLGRDGPNLANFLKH